MKSNPKYSKNRKDKIEEISNTFGNPRKDDKKLVNQSSVVYKDKSYNVVAANIPFPENKEELKKIEDILREFEEDDLSNENLDHHQFTDASPYETCATYLQNLLNETKAKLEEYITELENDHPEPNRLEKPNYIAFYRPYHFWPISWGIYLNRRLLNQEGARIFNYNNRYNIISGLTLQEAKRLSLFHTYFHEMYHHKFELLGTKFEILLRKPVYKDCFHKFTFKNAFKSLIL